MPSKGKLVEAKNAKQIVNVNVNLQEKKKPAPKKKGKGKGKKVQTPYRPAPAFHDTGAGYVSYARPIINEPYVPQQTIYAPSRQFIQDVPNPYIGNLSSQLELTDDKKIELYNYMVNRYINANNQARNQSVQGVGINIQKNPSELRENAQVNTLLRPEQEPSLGSMLKPQTLPEEIVNVETYDDPKVNEVLNSRMDTIPQKLPTQTFGLSTLNKERQYDNELSHLVDTSTTKVDFDLGEQTIWETEKEEPPKPKKTKKPKEPKQSLSEKYNLEHEESPTTFTFEPSITKKKGRPTGSKNKPKEEQVTTLKESASSAVARMFKTNASPDVKLGV